jgi:holo-[acyl-carrier protein] synthase
MILGVGSDLCDMRRIEASIERFGERFLRRCFTPAERAHCDARAARAACYAKRFAAKEAAVKALGSGIEMGVAWRQVEIETQESGQPVLRFHAAAAARLAALSPPGHAPRAHVTMTDDGHYAQAFVIIEALPA